MQMTQEELADLVHLATGAKAYLDGPDSDDDEMLMGFIAATTPRRVLWLLEQTARVSSLQAELAEQERAALGWAQELAELRKPAARRITADELPTDGEFVAVWWDKDEVPDIRYYDHGGEHWCGGNGTWSSRGAFPEWAPLPGSKSTPALSPSSQDPAGAVTMPGAPGGPLRTFTGKPNTPSVGGAPKMRQLDNGKIEPPCWPCPACIANGPTECLVSHCIYANQNPNNQADIAAAAPQGEETRPESEWQFPGMPQAKCHGCGLPSHVARCRSAECPMKGGEETLRKEGRADG